MPFLQPSDFQAILLSFKVACTATLLSTPRGIGVAYLLVHTRIPGKAMWEGIINLPLVLPPVVIGYLLLVLFGRHGWVGSILARFDIQIIFTLTGAIIASAVVGLLASFPPHECPPQSALRLAANTGAGSSHPAGDDYRGAPPRAPL